MLAIAMPGPFELLILVSLLIVPAAIFAIVYFAVRLANRHSRH